LHCAIAPHLIKGEKTMGENVDQMGGWFEPSSVSNVEDSLSGLFREIGTTLKDVTIQGMSTVGATVKTTLANKIINSPEGQAQVSAYKMEYIFKYLPWMALAAVAIFFGGKFFSK
jgi:hypothetical protein